jgi:YebC/PmpR family DNA-binding regulatory protein
MAGHSKWANRKHRKGAVDAKRGKIFTKIAKEIIVAARMGGGDPAGNPRLKLVIEKARAVNMPGDNIKRAIQRGTGDQEGVSYEEAVYEGYGPGGVAILIDALTDNKNRTVGELRFIMGKNGGSMGEAGCVAWMFDKKGEIRVPKAKTDEDTLMAVALDAGAEDLKTDDDETFQVLTDPSDLEAVATAVSEAGIEITSKDVVMIPQNTVRLETEADAVQVLKLLDALDDHDDVQNIYSNFDIPDEIAARVDAD